MLLNNTQEKVACGVPQGLVLGPKLFKLYLNNICTVLDKFKFVRFERVFETKFFGVRLETLFETTH